MRLFEELPPGLWLVKWIDVFHFAQNDSASASVYVVLQKLPYDHKSDIRQLDTLGTAELLGRPRLRSLESEPVMLERRLLAAYLPRVRVGDVFQDTSKIARLRDQRRSFVMPKSNEIKDTRMGRELKPPKEWTYKTQYTVLNKFEFQFGKYARFLQSRCFVFNCDGIQYILPKIVIFQTFYAFDSRLINALCNGPWSRQAKQLISFNHFQSGLTTAVDADGAWKIVVEMGIDLKHAPALALFWFDKDARARIEAIYADSLDQNHSRMGSYGREWFCNAAIPHNFEPRPFKMEVNGFSLRPLIPSKATNENERFLITAITASSWSLPDQVIEPASSNDNRVGDDMREPEDHRAYMGRKPAVGGQEGVTATSAVDPNVNSPPNLFFAPAFEYLDKLKVRPQRKTSSTSFKKGEPSRSEGPDSLVSGGNPFNSIGAPSKAQIVTPVRSPSEQFVFFTQALDELIKQGHIATYEPVSPTAGSDLMLVRNGVPCWSFIDSYFRSKEAIPDHGWEVVHDKPLRIAAGEIIRAPRLSKHARCMLIVSVTIAAQVLILFEIEPRSQSERYCFFAFLKDRDFTEFDIAGVLADIRDAEGVLKGPKLRTTFQALTDGRVFALHHAFKYATGVDGSKVITGLNSRLLREALLRVARRKSKE